jgi:hypothetical protein
MSSPPVITTAAAGEKRKVTPDGTAPDSKKSKPDSSTFRSWSADADGKPCKIFTFKCMLGNPDVPLSYNTKCMKVGEIRSILEARGLDTKGFKPVLLERLQRDLPYVRIELDSRECIQRLVNAFLHFMGWDNTHLFEITMPNRGPVSKGAVPLWEKIGLDQCTVTFNPEALQNALSGQNEQYRHHFERILKNSDSTWDDVRQVIANPRAVGPTRKLQGAAFDAFEGQPLGVFAYFAEMDRLPPAGGCHTLDELSLQAGDKLDVLYDFGDSNEFRIEIESVRVAQEPLPEAQLGYLNPTRVRLVNKGGRVRSQYDNSEDGYYDSEDGDY